MSSSKLDAGTLQRREPYRQRSEIGLPPNRHNLILNLEFFSVLLCDDKGLPSISQILVSRHEEPHLVHFSLPRHIHLLHSVEPHLCGVEIHLFGERPILGEHFKMTRQAVEIGGREVNNDGFVLGRLDL